MEGAPQNQNSIDFTKLISISKIHNTFFHQFGTQNLRELVDICDCQILQHINIEGTQVPSHYLKLGAFVQRMDDCIYVMASFQNLVTFVFENHQNQNSVYLVSIESFNPELLSFTQSIKQSTQVVAYKTDNFQKTSIKQKIQLICGGQLTQEMIQNVGSFGNVLKTVGKIFGSVAKNIADPAVKAQTIMHNGFNMISEKYVSDQNKNRWSVVKQGAASLNQRMTEMYKPIDNKVKWIIASISENFNKSENTYIKNIKKYGMATAKTLNNSYKKAEQSFLNANGKQNQSNPTVQLHENSTNNLTM